MQDFKKDIYQQRCDAMGDNWARTTGFAEMEVRFAAGNLKSMLKYGYDIPEPIQREINKIADSLSVLEKLMDNVWDNRHLPGYAESTIEAFYDTKKGLVSPEVA